jgi:methionine-rich copper-binding protein CopC
MSEGQKPVGHSRPGRKFRAAVLLAVLVLTFMPLQGASAHSPLISSTPKANDHLPSVPSRIELVFGAAVTDAGAVIELADEHGRSWTRGSPLVSGTSVSTSVDPGSSNGRYEARWEVVSHDGAKMSGTIRFTVGNAAPDSNPLNAVLTSTEAAYIRVLAFGIVGVLLLYMGFGLVTVYVPRSPQPASHSPAADNPKKDRSSVHCPTMPGQTPSH